VEICWTKFGPLGSALGPSIPDDKDLSVLTSWSRLGDLLGHVEATGAIFGSQLFPDDKDIIVHTSLSHLEPMCYGRVCFSVQQLLQQKRQNQEQYRHHCVICGLGTRTRLSLFNIGASSAAATAAILSLF
jgi:hypothetical protein